MKEFVMAHPYLTVLICLFALGTLEEIVRKICVVVIVNSYCLKKKGII